MQLPITSNSLLFWLDPAEKFVMRDSTNKLISVLNRVDGLPILPNSVTPPTWVDNSINGHPSLAFDGTQSLLFNFNLNVTSVGLKKPYIITIVAKNLVFSAAKNACICMAGSQNSANPGHIVLAFNSAGQNIIYMQRTNDTSQFAFNNPAASVDTNYHVYTLAYDGNFLRIRIDGTEISASTTSASNMTTASTLDQICVGNLAPKKLIALGAFINPFVGNIAAMVAYSANAGMPLDYSYETYLKEYFNL